MGSTLCNNNRDFIKQAIKEDVRIDGRQLYDHRQLSFEFSLDDSSATVRLGGTRAAAAVAAALEAPFNDRGREGSLRFSVELSPMASPTFESGRMGEDAIEIARIVERAIKQSGAVDMEALCVLPGRKVWSLRVDIHILDHCGNLVDAATLAALAALAAFRKPQVSVGQGEGGGADEIIVHSPDVREPQPLSLHHLPFPITFALFEHGAVVAIDPCLQEEAAMEGSMTLVINPHGEICAVQKADGVGLDRDQLMRCARLGTARAGELAGSLKDALKAHDAARVAARVRRHAGGAGGAGGAADGGGGGGGAKHVVVLRDVDQADARLAAIMTGEQRVI
ncbi:MAG: exoribonuclease PH component of the exosome [Monoraphidium minutum]|nr:MAG: exoribonuclease PH component of the exosome [Monoraphidium minutum]